MELRYTVKVERLVTIQTGRVNHNRFSEDEFTQQFNTLFTKTGATGAELSRVQNIYGAKCYRVTSWSK
tara:strand:- start:235 stop:438 length:204 start_codon:yes stop_codon:yes gene_type:complete